MINVLRKLVLTAMVASLTILGSVSYAAPGNSKGAGGWGPSADHREFVVISLSVMPADKVVLFTTIGGVELINPDNNLLADVCLTPGGMRSLSFLLEGFVNSGGEVVVCPLCAITRNITNPTHGVMGSGVDIHNLFLYADKVIDF